MSVPGQERSKADRRIHDRRSAARRSGGRDGVEQLPGEPLDGRASEDVRLGERGPGRIHESVEPGEHTDADRRFCLHAVGRRSAPRRDGPGHVLRAAVPRRVQARLPGVAPHGPIQRPLSPPSPFAMPQYRLAATQEADELTATAEASAELARTYIQRATKYVLAVVLFATSLFFAGISTKLDAPASGGSSSASDAPCSSWPSVVRASQSACRSEWDRLAPLCAAVRGGPMQFPACTDSTVVERGDHRFTVAPLVASTVLAGLVGWKHTLRPMDTSRQALSYRHSPAVTLQPSAAWRARRRPRRSRRRRSGSRP